MAIVLFFFALISSAAIQSSESKYIAYNTTHRIVPEKINVHLVPHSHDDVGWLKTVDQYYVGANNSIRGACVQNVLDSVISALLDDKNRKFIYVEMAFFQRWWRQQSETMRVKVKELVDSGQLEFINGGMCMHDEATPHYIDLIDQTTLGHQFIKDEFDKVPRVGWQIDPFGHSAVQAYLLGAELGFDSLFFARIDYQDRAKRLNEMSLEIVWQGSKSLGSSSQIFAGIFPRHYDPPDGFTFEINDVSPPIQDDVLLFDYNVQERVDAFVASAFAQANVTRTNHIMWTMGTDFRYQYANSWFRQMDKFIHYVNEDGRVNALYSTPSIYTEAKHAANEKWPRKTDDFFPYADHPNAYWTGYFTSRPALKGYVRMMSAYYLAARQLEFFKGRSNFGPNTDALADALAVAQHHDAVSGTEREHVAADYAKRLYMGYAETEKLVSSSLAFLAESRSSRRQGNLVTNFQQGMGKGEEHQFPLTPSNSNPSNSDIPQTGILNYQNYMHGYFGPVPAWSPAFLPYPDRTNNPSNMQLNVGYPFQFGMGPPSPFIGTSSRTSAEVGTEEDRPDCLQTEAPCTSTRPDERETDDDTTGTPTDDGTTGTPQVVPSSDGDDIVEEPKSGMKFNSFEELFSYYKHYGKKCGFGVMTQRSERSEDQSVRYVTLGCARGGKARNKSSNLANPRPTGKTDCKARINALRVEGKMRLTTVHNTHNHGLSPMKSRFFRCNREVSDSVKRVLDTNDLAGIRLNKSYGSLVVGAGGFENLPFLEKDCRNYIDKARHLRLGAGGAGALQDYFMRMQYKNNGFFSLMDLDDEGRLKNVFWADPRSRAAYQYFGDVVTFDTTYLTNRYGMPFAPFVGVNHHGQSILLGAGLISSEDTETFIWLFQTWLQCMDGIAPKAIITDQDRAMKNAIATVFPETRHRLCLWHILKKVPEKLGSYAAYRSGLKTELMKCVYDTQTIEDFEKCWAEFLNTYDLHENPWLKSLYVEREHWIPVFLKEHFWAGMSTTQRSESMNAFFDGYVHSKTNLKEFVDQFDSALKKKIENENHAEFQSFSQVIPCVSRSPIEKKFQELYTNAKFREVQQQVIGVLDLDPSLRTSDGVMKSYLVEDEIRIEEFSKMVTYSVNFNEEDCNAKCSCGLFQMRGILCRHILAVFKCNGIKSLPNRYILDRWRKDIKRRYTLIRSSYDAGDQRPNGNRYSILLNMCYGMITYAADSKEQFDDAKKRIHEMTECYREQTRNRSLTQTDLNAGYMTLDTTAVAGSQQVKSPLVVRGKGRPPSLRRASRMETDIRKVKAKQKKAQARGKAKQGDVSSNVRDTLAIGTRRNLFGQSEVDITNPGQVQTVIDSSVVHSSGIEHRETMMGSQESIFLGSMAHDRTSLDCDGSQPVQEVEY